MDFICVKSFFKTVKPKSMEYFSFLFIESTLFSVFTPWISSWEMIFYFYAYHKTATGKRHICTQFSTAMVCNSVSQCFRVRQKHSFQSPVVAVAVTDHFMIIISVLYILNKKFHSVFFITDLNQIKCASIHSLALLKYGHISTIWWGYKNVVY